MMTPTLAVHIAAGGVAVIGGFVALAARRQRDMHRAAGFVFVGTMLVMCLTAFMLYVERGNLQSAFGTVFVGYLVVTAVRTMRVAHTRAASLRDAPLDWGLAALALALGVSGVMHGVQTFGRPMMRTADGVPAPMLVLTGMVALLACWGDLRVLQLGVPRGSARLRRHLWRMCYALWLASGSFFIGRAKVIPAPIRVTPVLWAIALLPLAAMGYHAWRLRGRRATLSGETVNDRIPRAIPVVGIAGADAPPESISPVRAPR